MKPQPFNLESQINEIVVKENYNGIFLYSLALDGFSWNDVNAIMEDDIFEIPEINLIVTANCDTGSNYLGIANIFIKESMQIDAIKKIMIGMKCFVTYSDRRKQIESLKIIYDDKSKQYYSLEKELSAMRQEIKGLLHK